MTSFNDFISFRHDVIIFVMKKNIFGFNLKILILFASVKHFLNI